jgi:hypothetical protein
MLLGRLIAVPVSGAFASDRKSRYVSRIHENLLGGKSRCGPSTILSQKRGIG